MKVITLAKTKELLGITDSTYDTQISANIPLIDAKVKQITKNRFNYRVIGDLTLGETSVNLTSISNDLYYYRYGTNLMNTYYYSEDIYEDLQDFLQVGMLISGTGISADVYIDEVYYNVPENLTTITTDFIPRIELSSPATQTAAGVAIYLGANIAQQNIIAKGIWWMIQQTGTTITETGVQSRSLGQHSVSYGNADSKIDGKYGMPSWFVKAFPQYMRGY